jgi:hypothetical protein
MSKKPLILALSLFMALLPSTYAHAEDIYQEDTETSWGVVASDDGFTKKYTIYKTAINYGYSDFGTESTYTIELQCEKKKLGVIIYADPIGMYPTDDLSGIGYALVKIDSGKIIKYKFATLGDSSGIAIWTPKTLTSAMLKGKRQVAFKIASSIQADTVANFALADLSRYVNKFKSLGCPLK